MAITFDAASTNDGTGSPLTWSHTVGTGSERILLVGACVRKESDPRPTITAVTYGGVSLTQAVTRANDGKTSTDIWYLVNPTSGTATVSITTSSAPTNIVGGATSYAGVHQTSPIIRTGTGAGETALPTISIIAETSALAVSAVSSVSSLTVVNPQTQRWSDSNSFLNSRGGDQAGAGSSITLSWTMGGIQKWTIAALVLRHHPGPYVSPIGGYVGPDTSKGPGETDIILTNPGGANPHLFHASDLVMNRGVNEHGQLGFDLAYRDTIGYVSQSDRLRGKWVTWEHPHLGKWTGMIIDVRPNPGTGIIDCTAYGFTWKLRKRITPKLGRAISGPPGAIVSQVLQSAAREDPLPIAGIDAEEVGDPITYDSRSQKVDDVIRAIAARTGQEWYVDPDTRRLQWRKQYGRDRSGSVQLVDGVHLADYTPSFSLDGLTNALFVMPDDNRYRAARGFWEERSESIDTYGRLEDSQTYPGAVNRSSIGPIAREDLRKRSRRGRTMTIPIVNVDDCFGWFGPGDTIKILLSRLSVAYDFRVLVQSYRADTRILTCSGVIV